MDALLLTSVASVPLYLLVFSVAMRVLPIADRATKVFCASCAKDLLNALISGPLATMALCDLLLSNPASKLSGVGLLTLDMPSAAKYACAITCGFFVADCVVLLLHPSEMAKGLGGTASLRIMWVHHVLSLAIWPYAFANSISAAFALYFIATELTNIGQNVWQLAGKGGLASEAVETAVGAVWMLSFLVMRVLPVPVLARAYVQSLFLTPHLPLATAEWLTTALSVPIPIALNLFWFSKMVKKVARMLSGGKEGKKKKGKAS